MLRKVSTAIIFASLIFGLWSTAAVSLKTPIQSNMNSMKFIGESGNSSERNAIIRVSFGKGFTPLEDDYPPPREMTWTAYTNLVRSGSLFNWYPKLYACSKSRWSDNGEPADIQRIGIRSRVWKKVRDEWEQIYNREVYRYNNSDACIYWNGKSYGGGKYLARSNHWFEANSIVTWYPETEDSVNC